MLIFWFLWKEETPVFPQEFYFVSEMFFGAAEIDGKTFHAHIFVRLSAYKFKVCADVVRVKFRTALYALCHVISRPSDSRGKVCMNEVQAVR